ncbi:hypothetical protein [Shimia ponticola]|uniref:hypothetical protein n=1 Tax=Shimia ponticola TaxID=2582893 RepID=UPI0011BE5C7A|nr:hypothetical protein [Shimia ponticola]
MTDIVQRLRSLTNYPGSATRQAADEIELLRGLLARYRDQTPIGHQPHMIVSEVDQALGRHTNEDKG